METDKISVGNLVWAKLRFCPFWPARIVNAPLEVGTGGPNQLCVLFFGTKTYGWVRKCNIVDYSANRSKYEHKAMSRVFFSDAVRQMDEYIRDPIKYASHSLVEPINIQITVKREIASVMKTETDIDEMPFQTEKLYCAKEDPSVKMRAMEAEKMNIIKELIQTKGENQKFILFSMEKDREIQKLNDANIVALDKIKKLQTQFELISKESQQWEKKYFALQTEHTGASREYKTLLAQMKQLQLNMNDNNSQCQESNQSCSKDCIEYEVDTLIDDKVIRGKRRYLVKWKNSWIEECNLNCQRLLNKYLKSKKLNE